MKTKFTFFKLLILVSLFISTCEKMSARDYVEKTYYSNAEMNGLKLIPSEDGGYYILYTYQIASRSNVLNKQILKVDSIGNEVWGYDFEYQELAVTWTPSDIALSADTFIYAISHYLGCFSNATIFKFDRNGTAIFDRDSLGFTFSDTKLNALCAMPDNDLVAVGFISNGSDCSVVAPYLLRMNPDGSTQWEARWDSIYPGLSINRVEAYTDSSYIISLSDSTNILINDIGQIIPSNFPDRRFKCLSNGDYITYARHRLSRLDNSLTPIWQSPVFANIDINDLTINDSSEIFLTGRKDTCNGEMIIQKYDTSGNMIFTRTYGGDLNDKGAKIISADANHIAVLGNHFHHHWLINDATTNGCRIAITHSASMKLIVLPNDVLSTEQISSSTGDYTLCANDTITLTAPAGYTYSWSTGSTDQSITIDTSGSYEVTITDGFGNSEVLPVFNSYEYEAPVTPHFADRNYTMCTGNFPDLCFNVAHSDTIFDRQFLWNISDPQAGNPIVQAPFGGFTAGSYFCVVSNICGSDTSGYYVLENIPPTVSLGNDTVICTSSIYLEPEHSNSVYDNFLWQDSSQNSYYLAMATGYDTLQYRVTYTDAAGCSVSDSIVVIYDDCTGIASIDSNSGMNVYPNPMNGLLNISLLGISSQDEMLIKVISIDGKMVFYKSVHGNEAKIDLSEIDSGVYFLDVVVNDKKVLRSRVVKE